MCNLYNIATSQEAIRQWTRALRDIIGKLEPSIDIYPNQFANPLRGNPASRPAAGLPRRAGVDAADQPRLDHSLGAGPACSWTGSNNAPNRLILLPEILQ